MAVIAVLVALAASGNAHALTQVPERITFADAKKATRLSHEEMSTMLREHGRATVHITGCARRSKTVIVCRVRMTGDTQVITDRCFVKLTPGGNYATWLKDVKAVSRG